MTLASDFTSLGIVGYNGASFGPSVYTTCVMEPQEDESKRTVIYYTAHFTFVWYVDCSDQGEPNAQNPNTTTDAQLEVVRSRLMHAGGDFQYAGAGLGQISVNPAPNSPAVPVSSAFPGAAKQLDPVWGPKPRRFAYEGVGAKYAKCTFQIDVAFVNCPAVLARAKILEYCFSLDYGVTDGYTTKTVKGFVRIPGVRGPNQDRTLSDNADLYLEGAIPPSPVGFRRVRCDRTLSLDKCRLDFTVVDEQYQGRNFPPKACIRAEGSHSVRSPVPTFNSWTGVFRGTYEYLPGVSPANGFTAFRDWLLDRLETLSKLKGTAIIPTDLSMTEPEVYGRPKGQFELTYSYAMAPENVIQNALLGSGLWKPVKDSSYSVWSASMSNAWTPRGYAGLKFQNSNDLILDICAEVTKPVTPGGGGAPRHAEIGRKAGVPHLPASQGGRVADALQVGNHHPAPTQRHGDEAAAHGVRPALVEELVGGRDERLPAALPAGQPVGVPGAEQPEPDLDAAGLGAAGRLQHHAPGARERVRGDARAGAGRGGLLPLACAARVLRRPDRLRGVVAQLAAAGRARSRNHAARQPDAGRAAERAERAGRRLASQETHSGVGGLELVGAFLEVKQVRLQGGVQFHRRRGGQSGECFPSRTVPYAFQRPILFRPGRISFAP